MQIGPTVTMEEGAQATPWGWMSVWRLCPRRRGRELFTEVSGTLLTRPVLVVFFFFFFFFLRKLVKGKFYLFF